MDTDYCDFVFKILLVGNAGVGKSSLLLRFADDSFNGNFVTTIGVDYKIKTIEIDGKIIKLQIWDTAGQERFRTITSSYYRGCHAILVVYDITDTCSFTNVTQWLQEVDRYANESTSKLIVANKCDLEKQRQVSKAVGQSLGNKLGIKVVETSAKSGTNVDNCFYEIAKELKNKSQMNNRYGTSKNANSRTASGNYATDAAQYCLKLDSCIRKRNKKALLSGCNIL